MQKSLSSESQVIVVELGAEWPSASLAAPPSARRVLAQDEAESLAAFAVRVAEQLNGSMARGARLTSAVIACSERLDERAQGARADLVRALASALAHARGGNLTLSASDRNEGRSRAAFSALYGELAQEWQSAGVLTKLRFGDDDAAITEPKSRTGSRGGRGKDSSRRVA